jgi:hypothetical protein
VGPCEFLRWAEESYLSGVAGLRDLLVAEAERRALWGMLRRA